MDQHGEGPDEKEESPKKEKRPRCNGLLEELPDWMRDNEYIKSRYRIDYETNCEVLSTAFKCHNETVNVWTHLIGSIIMFILALFILMDYENLKFAAERAWDLFEQEKSYNTDTELDNYIRTQMEWFKNSNENFKNETYTLSRAE